jgi:hypothetical protein
MYTHADLFDLHQQLTRTTDEKLVSEIKKAIHIVEFEIYKTSQERKLKEIRRKFSNRTKEFYEQWLLVYLLNHGCH